MSKATVREAASRLVRDSHWEWFDKMSLKDKLIFLIYSCRFGVEVDHMNAKARHSCSLDADAFLSALRAAGLVVVPVEPTDAMVLASIILPNDPKEAQLREAFKNAKHRETIEKTRASIARAIAASQDDNMTLTREGDCRL